MPAQFLAGQTLAASRLEILRFPPACSVFNTPDQLVSSGSTTILAANTQNFDNDGMHNPAVQNSRITIQTPGRYLISSAVTFAEGGTGNRRTRFVLNGVDVSGAMTIPTPNVTHAAGIVNTRILTLDVGDFIQCAAFHNQGSSLDVGLREFSALRISGF